MHTYPHLSRPSLVFRALGSDRRLRIIELLSQREYIEKELITELGICAAAVSKHIHQLLYAGFITGQRNGMEVRFSLSKSINISSIIDIANLFAKR